MALTVSPPPPQSLTAEQEEQSILLDEDIAKVRAEINALTQRHTRLTSALISTTQVQSRLRQHPAFAGNTELTEVLDQQIQHNQQSTHRLAFGVTAFPFVDPNPDTSNVPLVGIRFDICKRNGQFDAPYYALCKRVNDEGGEVRVHRHTIPALIPLSQYEEKYLPLPDEGYGSEDSVLGTGGRQDLEGFAQAVRTDLVAWRLRQESLEMVRDSLGLKDKKPDDDDDERTGEDEVDGGQGRYGVKNIEAVAVDACYARILWTDGRVGRIRIGDDGSIQRAVVIGVLDEQEQRITQGEQILVAENSRVDTLVERLKETHQMLEANT
jgi:central kinetochore subunit Mal2/MCM21